MNAILLTLLLTSAAPQFEAATLDGRTVTGELVALSPAKATIAAKAGQVSFDVQSLLTLSAKSTTTLSSPAGVVVELLDGSVVRGKQFSAQGKGAKIALADGQTIEMPAKIVRSVQLRAANENSERTGANALDAEWTRLAGKNGDGDLLVVRSGAGIEQQKGVLHDVTDEVVRFDLDGDVLSVKRSKVFGFVYHRNVEPNMPQAVCRITDADGSTWAVQSVTLAGELRWTTPTGVNVSRPLEGIARIDFSGGKLAYLSDWEPDSVDWTPYFGAIDVAAVRRHFAPRFDRGFDSSLLRLGGVDYEKGLAIHCRTELVYRLPARYGRFQAIAGIDDAIRPGGKARLVVRGDDRVLFDGVIVGEGRPIDLNIQGVRRLVILVDFADGPGAGDRLLLCNARVLQ